MEQNRFRIKWLGKSLSDTRDNAPVVRSYVIDETTPSFRRHWKQLAVCLLVYAVAVIGYALHAPAAQSVVMPLSVEGFITRWALYYLFAMAIGLLGALPFCVPVLLLEYIGFSHSLPTAAALFRADAVWGAAILLQARLAFLLIPSWIALIASWQQTKQLVRYKDIRYLNRQLPTRQYTLLWVIMSLVMAAIELGIF